MLEIEQKPLPDSQLTLRSVSKSEIHSAIRLSTQAGWNQIEFDWEIFLEHGTVFGLFTSDNLLVATTALLPYKPNFAWISMVIVDTEWRRQRLATILINESLELLGRNKLVPVLDATNDGSKVYSKLGFLPHKKISRLLCAKPNSSLENVAQNASFQLRPFQASDLKRVISWDAHRFGGDRAFLISKLQSTYPKQSWIAVDADDSILGFVLGRNGRSAHQLGPICAQSDELAAALLQNACANIDGPAYIDVPNIHFEFIQKRLDENWSLEREFTRMSLAPEGGFSQFEQVYAIAGPELG